MSGADRFRIGAREVGSGRPCFVIAEIGSNHGGELETARRLIVESADAGADAVKFQTFRADEIVSRRRRPEVHELLRGLELPADWHAPLRDAAGANGVEFLSTPFDPRSADLVRSVDPPAYKIASGDVTNMPLLRHVGAFGRPVLLSVGAATEDEIAAAVATLRAAGVEALVLLQCVVSYPTPVEAANIRVLDWLRARFDLPVGYSDHSPGVLVPLGAVARGACVIEKHVTYDRTADGPDHAFALEISELRRMVEEIRTLEAALGTGVKDVADVERDARWRARRGLYARRAVRKGEVFGAADIAILRPAEGLAPSELERVIGSRAARDVDALAPIEAQDLVERDGPTS